MADSDLTMQGVVTAIIGIVTVSIAVTQLKEHPRIRVFLFCVIFVTLAIFVWYASPMVTSGQLRDSRARLNRSQQLDDKINKEAQESVDTQHEIELAKQRAELYQAQQKEAEAQRERDIATQKEEEERQHLALLQQAKTNLAAQTAIQGTWKCGALDVNWVFNPDGTVSIPFFSGTYEVIDSKHVRIKQSGISLTYDLDLTGTEQTLTYGIIYSCKRPRP